MKQDFDKSRRPDPVKPKPQPTRKATVSTPSPAPSPSGEVPRTTAKRQDVPKKDWSKSSTLTAGQGITRAKPVKKDWDKTGASAPTMEKPKDWSRKVERTGEVKKAPTPRHDLDRSR